MDTLDPYKERISWDYPCQSFSDVMTLPVTQWMNIKPSRFGLLSELLRVIEYCLARGIKMYGGGQFELGIGRIQAQEIASLFYPDGPNDLAPSVYNGDDLPEDAPRSPLAAAAIRGFGKT